MRGDGRIFLRGRVWWVAYYLTGHGQMRESSQSTDEATARKLLAKRIRAAANHRDGSRAFAGPKSERVTVDELLDALTGDYERRGIKSLRHTIGHMAALRDYLGSKRAVTLGPDDISRYIAARRGDGLSSATINRETAILTTAYRLAIKEERIARRPHIPKLPERNARSGFFEPAQHALMLAHLAEPLADMARLAYACGWRQTEVRRLRWEHVDRIARELRLSDSKNGRPRTLPLTGDLWEMFERLWTARSFTLRGVAMLSEWVFHRRGRPVSHSHFSRLWCRARKAAGPTVAGRIFHDYRRTAVRNLIRAGVPQSVAMSITGHVSDAIFRRYDITSTVDQVEAMAKQRAYLVTLSRGGNAAEGSRLGAKVGDKTRRRSRK